MHTENFHESLLHNLAHKKWNQEVVEFYIYKVLREISFSLLSIFLPIFLYAELNYSIFEILLFFIINQVIFLIFVPFSGKIIEKIGVKHSIVLHLPAMALFTYSLRYLHGNFYSDIWIIILILIIKVIPKSSKTTAETIFVSKNILNQKGTEGKSLSYIKITLIIASLLSPLIGGLVTYLFGFEYFFNVAIVITLFATIPLLLTKDKYFKIKESPTDILKFTYKEIPKNFYLAEGGRWLVASIIWVIWPLFIFLVVKNTINMGAVVSISSFVAIIVSYYVGKIIDKKSPKKLLKKMTRIATSVFFLRTAFPHPVLIVITDSINKVINPVLMIPYQKYYYGYIKSIDNIVEISTASNFILELYFTISYIFLAIIFGFLEYFNVIPGYWTFVIIFFIYGMFMLFMNRISNIDVVKN